LAGIKKEQTTIAPPSTFNLLINEEQDKWFKEKAYSVELDQKKIDDLQVVRVTTDGVYEYSGIALNPIGPDAYNGMVFTLPVNPSQLVNNEWLGVPPLALTQLYPRYRRLLNIEFKIRYKNNECELTGISKWLQAHIMRSDQLVKIKDNPYRRPKDSRLYYEILNNKIRLITGTESTGYLMKLEYLRYLNSINFVGTGSPANVDCELHPEQQQEIVDRAVMTYIERSKNPRFQTILVEQQKNQVFK
jgi:hypothetical protein